MSLTSYRAAPPRVTIGNRECGSENLPCGEDANASDDAEARAPSRGVTCEWVLLSARWLQCLATTYSSIA
jgi:hypothetical protein